MLITGFPPTVVMSKRVATSVGGGALFRATNLAIPKKTCTKEFLLKRPQNASRSELISWLLTGLTGGKGVHFWCPICSQENHCRFNWLLHWMIWKEHWKPVQLALFWCWVAKRNKQCEGVKKVWKDFTLFIKNQLWSFLTTHLHE